MSWYWPWNRQQTPSEPPAAAAAPPPAPLDGSLEARLSQLTAELAGLRLEWSETLDKLGRWASRQAARDRRRVDRDLDQLSEGSESHEDTPGDTNGGGPGVVEAQTSRGGRAALKAALWRQAAQLNGRDK